MGVWRGLERFCRIDLDLITKCNLMFYIFIIKYFDPSQLHVQYSLPSKGFLSLLNALLLLCII